MGRFYRVRFSKDPHRFIKKKSLKINLFPVQGHDFVLSEESLGQLRAVTDQFTILKEWGDQDHQITPYYSMESLLEEPPPSGVLAEIIAATLAQREKGLGVVPMYQGRSLEKIPNTFFLDRPGGIRSYRWSWEHPTQTHKTLKDYFTHLFQVISDPQTRFVLSLGAGALRL